MLWGNRNWAPYLADVIAAAHGDGQVRLLGLATSAYSSYSSCRQYREDFGLALADTGPGRQSCGSTRCGPTSTGRASGSRSPTAPSTAIRAGALAAGLDIADLEIVFTTHSIPVTMADTSGSAELGDHGAGGAYVTQHLAVARAVIDQVRAELGAAPSWQLAYQSRSGPPSMPWLEPDINDVIDDLAAAGRRGVIVVPIGFVSDHVEVIWDLDNEAAETAAEHGLFFARVRDARRRPAVRRRAGRPGRRSGSASAGRPESTAAARCDPPAGLLRRRLLRELPGDPADHRGGRIPPPTGPDLDVDPARLAALRASVATRRAPQR